MATVTNTKARLATMEASYPKEMQSIADERELLKTILRLLGIMDDQVCIPKEPYKRASCNAKETYY